MVIEELFPKDSDIVFCYCHQLWPGLHCKVSGEGMSKKLGLITKKYLGKKYMIEWWRKLVS